VAAALGQGVVTATAGTATLLLTGSLMSVTAGAVALTWFQGDVVGGLLIAPMLLMPSTREAAAPASKAESWAAMGCTAAVTLAIFLGGLRSGHVHVVATYLCLLPLAWGIVRCPPVMVAAQVALVGLVSALVTVRGMGPFTGFPNLNSQLISLQVFTTAQALMGQLLAILQHGRRRSEAKLLQSRETALEGSRAKSRFLALMSHEIRTPLNGILGAAELLSSSPLNTEQRQLSRAILSSGKGLMVLLNDLLDLSRIEAGRLIIVPAPFQPRSPTTWLTCFARCLPRGYRWMSELTMVFPGTSQEMKRGSARFSQTWLEMP
jgi:signal transduction histidine kinase